MVGRRIPQDDLRGVFALDDTIELITRLGLDANADEVGLDHAVRVDDVDEQVGRTVGAHAVEVRGQVATLSLVDVAAGTVGGEDLLAVGHVARLLHFRTKPGDEGVFLLGLGSLEVIDDLGGAGGDLRVTVGAQAVQSGGAQQHHVDLAGGQRLDECGGRVGPLEHLGEGRLQLAGGQLGEPFDEGHPAFGGGTERLDQGLLQRRADARSDQAGDGRNHRRINIANTDEVGRDLAARSIRQRGVPDLGRSGLDGRLEFGRQRRGRLPASHERQHRTRRPTRGQERLQGAEVGGIQFRLQARIERGGQRFEGGRLEAVGGDRLTRQQLHHATGQGCITTVGHQTRQVRHIAGEEGRILGGEGRLEEKQRILVGGTHGRGLQPAILEIRPGGHHGIGQSAGGRQGTRGHQGIDAHTPIGIAQALDDGLLGGLHRIGIFGTEVGGVGHQLGGHPEGVLANPG